MSYTYYKHFHLHGVDNVPSITFRITEEEDKSIALSWALCSREDNFCRKTGRELADENKKSGVFLFGTRTKAPLAVDIKRTLNDRVWAFPDRTDDHYANMTQAALEEVHMAEAFLDSVSSEEDGLWNRYILPWLYKTQFFHVHFH